MTLRRATAVLALLGIAIAGYLTWIHYAHLDPVCVGGGGGCERVQSSRWAELGGIPVAVLGLGGYIAILASLLLPALANRLVELKVVESVSEDTILRVLRKVTSSRGRRRAGASRRG